MQLIINRPNIWPNLQDEKKIYLISPAYPNSDAEIAEMVIFLENRGIEPILFNFSSKNTEPFLAHSDEMRLAELKNALYGNESNIIMATRGGYGTSRLLPQLLKLPAPSTNKLLIGFSDITSLHLLCNNNWGLSSLHGPTLGQCARGAIDQESIDHLFNILDNKGKTLSYSITPLNSLAESIQPGAELPPLLGGNLSLIQTSIGTTWDIAKPYPFSMLLEEYDEPAYALDRSLRHLLNAGVFSYCQTLFIGDINQKSESQDDDYTKHALDNFIPSLNIPIFRIGNIGHKKTNLAIPLGTPISVSG